MEAEFPYWLSIEPAPWVWEQSLSSLGITIVSLIPTWSCAFVDTWRLCAGTSCSSTCSTSALLLPSPCCPCCESFILHTYRVPFFTVPPWKWLSASPIGKSQNCSSPKKKTKNEKKLKKLKSCPNHVWAIIFDWSALSTWNKHFWTAFDTEHLAPGNSGARCRHLAHHLNLVSGVSLKRAFKMQFRNAYFRSLVHSSQKLWPKPD